MNAEEKSRYFQELTLNLQHEGFVVKPEMEEGLLPLELDGQRLCLANELGYVAYHGTITLEGLMRGAPTEQRQGPQMGGLT